MPEAFIGEIRLFPFTKPPEGWLPCDGRILKVGEYMALASLLRDTYGGDGRTTFALPDLRGRTPIHLGTGVVLGQTGGEEVNKLLESELPPHSHAVTADSGAATSTDPGGNFWAANSHKPYSASNQVAMNPEAVTQAGSGQPHPNMQPYAVLGFYMAVNGIYPSQL